MKLFRKNKTVSHPKQEELADRIAGRIVRFQERIAAYLNGRTRYLTHRNKLLLLIVFCVLFAAINTYLLINNF